jgi:L-amino acid N-acyltransferase YncA
MTPSLRLPLISTISPCSYKPTPPSQGGSLTGEFPRETVARMVSGGMPVIVARREQRLVGVLFSAAKDGVAPAPSVKAMWSAWPGAPSAYVYGPVCIADTERGRGLLPQLYMALKEHCRGREAVLFIRRDNLPSLRAHERLGMREVARFTLDGFEYAVYSDGGP